MGPAGPMSLQGGWGRQKGSELQKITRAAGRKAAVLRRAGRSREGLWSRLGSLEDVSVRVTRGQAGERVPGSSKKQQSTRWRRAASGNLKWARPSSEWVKEDLRTVPGFVPAEKRTTSRWGAHRHEGRNAVERR